MSAERKKLLWVSISACVFVLVVLTAGFFLLQPKKGGEQAPATIGNSAPPKAQDPHDFLSAPPPTPSIEQPKAPDGSVIVVYGDKPAPSSAAQGGTQASPAAGAGASGSSPAGVSPTGAAAGAASAAGQPASAGAVKGAKIPASAAAGKKPAVPVSVAKIAAKPATVKADEFWIQTGSFTSRGRADELKQSLAEKGVAALIVVKDIGGKSYYRVRIGPYSIKAEADDWLSKLKAFPGCSEAFVSKAGGAAIQKPSKK
jgi:DedD protein